MAIAAVLVAIGMGIGALGSHALQQVLSAHQLESLHTAVEYQLFNALGLFLVGVLMHIRPHANWRRIAIALTVGVICFSGGIYLMLAGAPRLFGYVTPIGGVLMIGSWVALGLQLARASASGGKAG